MPFSENTLEYLRKAGWSEDRRIDLSVQIAECAAKGLPTFPAVIAFMERYGDLEVRFLYPQIMRILPPIDEELALALPEYYTYFAFRARRLGYLPKSYNYDWCRKRIKKPLCQVGWIEGQNALLLMDTDGRVYGTQHNSQWRIEGKRKDYLWCIANSGEEAIEAILNGLPPVERYDNYDDEMKLERGERKPRLSDWYRRIIWRLSGH